MSEEYRPSNGTEGECFIAAWCDHCERDKAYRDGYGDGCPIVSATFIYNVNNPEYPNEWTYDANGKPCCTAFVPVGEVIPLRDDKTVDMFEQELG
ncbi:MAG: hypothetical protein HY272_01815 [Gammaproteobacteria bacterium]|nr:hypothetical protein [Gammaproteobacteria bacterium]